MIWLGAIALALLNLLWLALNLLTLPGNWLMVLTTLGFAYLTRQHPMLSPAVLVAVVVALVQWFSYCSPLHRHLNPKG